MNRIGVPTLITIFFAGCSAHSLMEGNIDGNFGPGVINPYTMVNKIEATLTHKPVESCTERARTMFHTLTWYQAVTVYRASKPEVREILIFDLLFGQQDRFQGMSKKEIVALLGKPDADGSSDGFSDDEIVYTGAGRVSDGMSGYIFKFNKDVE